MNTSNQNAALLFLIKKYRPLKGWSAVLVYGALALGVAAMVVLFRFSERIKATVYQDAKKFIAADYQIQSRRPPTKEVFEAADKIVGNSKLRLLQTDLVASATLPSQDILTVSLRALEGRHYPFYGDFVTEPQIKIDELIVGENIYGALVDASLKERGLKLGDVLLLGATKLTVQGFVLEEPQSVASSFALGPRLIVHQKALKASKLTEYGSYAFYSLLLKSSKSFLDVQKIMRETIPEAQWRLISPERANQQTSRVVTRLESFLMLIAFAAFVLGGVGLFSISRFQILRNIGDWILFKALGISKKNLLLFCVFWISIVALISVLVGFTVGVYFENLLVNYARLALAADLSIIPVLTGLIPSVVLTVLVTVFALGAPLAKMMKVSPSEAWSSTKTQIHVGFKKNGPWLLPILIGFVLVLVFVGLLEKSWFVTVFWLLATWASAWSVRFFSKKISQRSGSLFERYPLLWIYRSWSEINVLVYAVSASLFLMVFVSLVAINFRSQLLQGKSNKIPEAVVLGLLKDQKEAIFSESLLPPEVISQWAATLQMRIKEVNGKAVKMAEFDEEGARVEDEQSMSYSLTREFVVATRENLELNEILTDTLQTSKMFQQNDAGDFVRLSLESNFADRLEVEIGSKLKINIAGVDLDARVDSIRKVQWFRFQPSFLIVAHPQDLSGAPLNYIGLLNRVKSISDVQKILQKRFSNVTVIDANSVAQKLLTLIDRVVLAISSLGFFVLVASVWVYCAVIVSRRPYFREDLYLIRIMGGQTVRLKKIALKHFIFLALGAGLVSTLLALVAGWLLSEVIFGLTPDLILIWQLLGAAMGVSVVFAFFGYALCGPYGNWHKESQDFGLRLG